MNAQKEPVILIIGDDGQVGWELRRTLSTLGKVVAAGLNSPSHPVNLAQPESARNLIQAIQPDWIINAAAYTAVDKAEEEEALATQINGHAPAILAEAAKQVGALLVHYSTDYVYDGTKTTPYVEGDAPNPQSVYGRSKLLGDQGIAESGMPHLIFRSSWVYTTRGHNFLRTMRRLAREREELSIVADQIGCPTWARQIAEVTAQVLACLGTDREAWGNKSGIYHLVADGQGSWFDFASAIIEHQRKHEAIKNHTVHPIGTDEYPLPAPRPAYSVLSTEKLRDSFGIHMPDWKDGLKLALEELIEEPI